MENGDQLNLISGSDINATVDDFDLFWRACPLRVGKLYAKKCYVKARKIAPHDEIMAGLERYKRYKPNDRDWLHPSTFLNQGRWMDEIEAEVVSVPMQTVTEETYRIWAREQGYRYADDRELPHWCNRYGEFKVPAWWKPKLKEVG